MPAIASPKSQRLLTAPFTFQKLELFCRVVALGSVTKAAEELHVVQPAVTAHIRAIERRLGVALVYREGRNLALTEAGQRFHAWCEDILTRCGDLSRDLGSVADGTSGHATIAASMTAGSYRLSDLLTRYWRQFPNVTVTLNVGNVHFATEAVRNRTCDFAVLLLDPSQNLEGLVLEPLWEDKLLLLGSPERAAELRSSTRAITPKTIAKLPFVTSPRDILRRTLEDQLLYSAGVVSRKVVMELGHPEAMKQAVKQGVGFSFLEESAAAADIARGELAVIPAPRLDLRLPIYLAQLKDRVLSPMHRRLMAFIRQSAE
jgi:DNA-binding transcriptional LysR family regulator